MTDKKKKNKIADILLDFYDEHCSNEINRPMIPSIYAGKILDFIDSLQEESPTVYVITRCEEHSDYVEKVFLDYNKAVDYCGQFEGKEDEYGRDITKIEVTL